jgi:hypothetical protein
MLNKSLLARCSLALRSIGGLVTAQPLTTRANTLTLKNF